MELVKDSSLFLFAHQDDEFGIFQKIVEEQKAGQVIYCAYLTDGAFRGAPSKKRNLESLAVLAKLNVKKENIFFPGTTLSISDGSLPFHIEKCRKWINDFLIKNPNVSKIYLPAWEGGHQDHDALHAIGVRVSEQLGYVNKVFQFPLYNAQNCKAPFFKVFHPLEQNGQILCSKIPFRDRIRFLRYCLKYPSQLKTWVVLFPCVFFHYLVSGIQLLQPASVERTLERPHDDFLLYEKRGFFSWEKMSLCLSILLTIDE